MKKTIKRIALTITILLAIIGATGTVALASGYITWGGSQDFQQTLINLDLIAERGNQLKADKQNLIVEKENLVTEYEQLVSEHENTYRENEQLLNVIKDKENQINALEQEIEALEKRVVGNKTTQDQLKQAEKDMRDVKNASEQVLSELNDN